MWEDCSELWYYSDACIDNCGNWYWLNNEHFWVSCDLWYTWESCNPVDESDCFSEWIWEDCTNSYFKWDYCLDVNTEEQGWWYLD